MLRFRLFAFSALAMVGWCQTNPPSGNSSLPGGSTQNPGGQPPGGNPGSNPGSGGDSGGGDGQPDGLPPPPPPEKLQLVKTITLSDAVTEMLVDGNYLYIAQDGSAGVDFFSISDRLNPAKVAHYTPRDNVSGMYQAGNKLYTAETQYGLGIIDVSNPLSPSFIAGVQSFNGLHNDVVVKTFFQPITTIAFVSNTPRGVVRIDVTDPHNAVTITPDLDTGNGAGDMVFGGLAPGPNLYVETIGGSKDILVQAIPGMSYLGGYSSGGGVLALRVIVTTLWASRESGGYDWLRMNTTPIRDGGYVGPELFTDASESLTLNVLALAATYHGLQIRSNDALLASYAAPSGFITNKVKFASSINSNVIYATERSTNPASTASYLRVFTYTP